MKVRLHILFWFVFSLASASSAQQFSAQRNTYAQSFIDQDGKLYTWGAINFFAADSIERGETPDPIEVKHPLGKKWKAGFNGSSLTALLDEDGHLYKVPKAVLKFTAFDGEDIWIDASADVYGHALVSANGNLYYAGRLFTRTSISPRSFINFDTLTLMPTAPDSSEWVSVAVSEFHFAALTKKGHIYCFGDNSFGQFGCGDTNIHTGPTEMVHPDPEFKTKWKKVVVWDRVTIAIDEHDQLFYTGVFNYFPKHLAGDIVTSPQLVVNTKNEKWKDVQISYHGQAIGLTEHGSLYAWGVFKKGWGPFGASIPKDSYFTIPREVPTPDSVTSWQAIGVMLSSSYAVDQHCRIWGWGRNHGAEIGYDRAIHTEVDTPIALHRFCQTASVDQQNGPEATTLSNLRLFPNPSSGSVNVEFDLAKNEIVSIDLLDMLGRSVNRHVEYAFHEGRCTTTFSLSNILAGNYILRVQTRGQVLSSSLIVE